MKSGLGRKGVALVVFLLICGSVYGKPWPGSGDANDPYQIHNAQQMQAIGADANYWGAHFRLMKDIDLSAYTGTSFNIIGGFTGVFDGDGHAISNFTYDSNGVNYVGLFGYIGGPEAVVTNLGLIEPNIDAGTGYNVGCLIGRLGEGTVTDCYVVGGSVSGGYGVGGLVGINYDGEIADCYSTSNVTGGDYVGGLAGGNGYGSIRNCYSTGVVTGGGWSIGGLVGYNEGGYYGEVINSYWDTESSGIDTSYWGVGLTTADMHSKHTFFLWGCEGGWTIDEGNDYPRLAWEGKVGEAIEGFGCGTEEEPYLVYGASSMYVIGGSGNYDKHYKVMADIDVGGYIWTSRNIIGRYSESIDNSPFTGVFDGDGHTISNFTCDSNNVDRIGLFGYVDDAGAEIKDLGLTGPNVSAGTGRYVGGLVGHLAEGSVSGCYIEGGSVAGDHYVGGLVGEIVEYGSISNCYSTCGVTGSDIVGGLVGGFQYEGDISSCYSTGTVTGGWFTGGLVGMGSKDGFIRNSYWDMNSSGTERSDGGLGLTTEQMQSKSTYLFWGCEPVWTIDDGNDYPRLAWEGKPGGVIDYGCGTEEEPYLIYDGSSMYMIGAIYSKYNYYYCDDCDNVDKHYRLMADVDLSEYTGTSFNIIGSPYRYHNCFTGVFDGNGHSISNFTYECNGVDNIGLFGYVCEEGEVRDVVLINPDVNAGDGSHVGALVGYLEPNSLIGCRVEGGRIRGGDESIGGLLGFGEYVSLYNCGYEGSVRGKRRAVGGLVGEVYGDEEIEISNCYSRGVVTGLEATGGLVGYLRAHGGISNCYSESIVTGGRGTGGLIGLNSYNDISNSYSTGDVTGEDSVGGLAGDNRGVISNSYSTGSVTGEEYVGGLVGGSGGDYIKCFWDSEVNPDVNGTGYGGDPNVVGLPTVLMQTESTYTDAGWDFVGEVINGTEDIWKMNCEGMSYPKLSWWEAALGDFVCPDGVDMFDFGVLGDAWMSVPGDGHWDAGCDISEPNDNVIDGLDLGVFVGNWLEGM
ncbi:MAG: hypothetical protein JSW23_02980 [Planctomycetota bacterium]|nr:MAG: hypothetical protein JSW23_02980 [Planctomycetota bacterium]